MKNWLIGVGIFILLSGLVSYYMEASFVVAPSVVAVLFIIGCFIHFPEERPGGIDNPDGKLGNPMHLAAVLAGVIVICVAIGHFFPATAQYGLYNLAKPSAMKYPAPDPRPNPSFNGRRGTLR